MEIREVREDEYEDAIYIGREAFAYGSFSGISYLRDPDRPPMHLIGAWDEGGMQARLNILGYQMHFGPEVVLDMGGIGGVCCLPASRGKGYAGKLLQAAFVHMRDVGQTISSLYPFNWDFYRKYGYEWVGWERTYSVPASIMRVTPETERVRMAKPNDLPAIVDCYTRFSQNYRGMLKRSDIHWKAEIKDEDEHYTYTYLYEANGKVDGYLILNGGKKEEARLRAFIAVTTEARAALLGLLHRKAMQSNKFIWDAPDNDPLYFQLCHNDVEVRSKPVTQARVVDVSGAFSLWKPNAEAKGSVTFAVQDTHADWNTGVWLAEFENGETLMQKTDREPQVSLDILALSQAFFGYPTLDTIRKAGRLSVHDEAGYKALSALLDGPPMWTCDHF